MNIAKMVEKQFSTIFFAEVEKKKKSPFASD